MKKPKNSVVMGKAAKQNYENYSKHCHGSKMIQPHAMTHSTENVTNTTNKTLQGSWTKNVSVTNSKISLHERSKILSKLRSKPMSRRLNLETT